MPAPTIEQSDAGPARGARKRWSRGARIQMALLAVVLLFWGGIYAYTLTVDGDSLRPPGRLTDTAFAVSAEPICAGTVEEIDALGLPTAVETALERADLVADENVLLRGMLDRLDGLARPVDEEEAGWVSEWLADWRVHVEDRQRWADRLRAGDDGPFTETPRAGEQLSRGIDYFAETNDMPSCVTPGDV